MAKKSNVETLIVKSKVREYVKSLGEFQMSSDFIDALNGEVAKLIKQASERTKANNRKTLSARDV